MDIAVVVELILDTIQSLQVGGVSKDERDILIEPKGYRNAYYVLAGALVAVMVHLFISDMVTTAQLRIYTCRWYLRPFTCCW